MARSAPTRRLTVLQSTRALRQTTNPYIVQLVRSLGAEADVRLFSWPTALLGRWDVLHVHWPELLVARRTRLRTLAHAALCGLLLLRLRLTRRALVRTAHNLAPHDAPRDAVGAIVGIVLRMLDRSTTLWVLLNGSTRVPAGAPHAVIPHGHYRDWYSAHPRSRPVTGRVLFFGLVRRYKNVPHLLQAFTGVHLPGASLHVIGKPEPAELGAEVAAAASADPRVTLSLGYADDERLAREMSEAQLVALPYRELHNSGAMLLALSLGRPVLVPDNPVTADIAAEVGAEWVRRYQGELTPRVLEAGLAAGIPAGQPDLSRREWGAAASAHLAAYRRAIQIARHGRRYSE